MIIEIGKFFIYALCIVGISKYILVKALRKLAENLQLKAKTIGNIAGIATSIPEFLTVIVSSFRGFMSTSFYNILSSNVINFIQYILSLIINKNLRVLKNKGILLNMLLVFITILIPFIIIISNVDIHLYMVIVLVILYILFSFAINRIHKQYFLYLDQEIKSQEKFRDEQEKNENKKSYVYVLYIVISGVILYFIGNELGEVLQNLADVFGISQSILGILLGFITSIPELITFFEAQKHYKNSDNNILGVIETTNNLLASNMLNLFIIQSMGILIYICVSK